jgi:P-type E1-E2 ATPase
MEQYNECVPELAEVRRKGRWVKMDSASVVPGDVIKVDAGQRIPADLRIIEAKQCAFDTSYVTGSTHKLTADPSKSAQNYLDSPNMAFLGYLCTTGLCSAASYHRRHILDSNHFSSFNFFKIM